MRPNSILYIMIEDWFSFFLDDTDGICLSVIIDYGATFNIISPNIRKIYVGPIQVVDRQSIRSTSIHSRVLPIQFRALGMALRVPWSIPELCHWIFEHPDPFRSFLLDRRAPVSIPEFLIGSLSTITRPDLNLPYPNYF